MRSFWILRVGPKFNDECPYKETEERGREEEKTTYRQHRLELCRQERALVFCYRESYCPQGEIPLPFLIWVTFS